jgi:capsular polysaccharide export protein
MRRSAATTQKRKRDHRQKPVQPQKRFLDEDFRGKNVLLLQGPLGPFFKHLAAWLIKSGATVHKINFNGGDVLFYSNGIRYRGVMQDIPEFIENFCKKYNIDTIMLFGDCRPVHRGVHALAQRHGLDLRVFEEGYLRPDYITCERHGVNGYSSIPRSQQFYLDLPDMEPPPEPQPLKRTYWHMAARAFLYYIAAQLLVPLFPNYRHHRSLTVLESIPWIRSLFRKYFYAFLERGQQKWLAASMNQQYFLVPLQVYNDAQISNHSKYTSITEFISEVMISFATHAPQSTLLVIKHHPMDRAYTDYRETIRKYAVDFGIENRVLYIHDQHLPTLLAATRGVVVINSTVGFSAIQKDIPVKVCGDTFYDFDGLTFRGILDDFWMDSEKTEVDIALCSKFRTYLRSTSQVYGSFYLNNSIFIN